MLDTITTDDEKKQQLLQGEVIDKAERLSKWLHYMEMYDLTTLLPTLEQVRLIQEKLGQFQEALRQQHR